MQRICNTLVANNYTVTIVGRKLKNSLPLETKSYKEIRLNCFFNKGKLFYLEYNIRLLWFLLFYEADIYTAIDVDTIIPVYGASFIKSKKRVFDAHEYFEEVPEVVNRKITKAIWSIVAKKFIPLYDVCYTVGESLGKEFEKLYLKKFGVIKNVPDLIAAENNTKGKYLLYQGALNEGRGIEPLIKAMHHLKIPLKIAGEGDLSTYLRALVKKEQLENKIEFLGFVKPNDLPALTSNAFIGLNLLENKGKSYYYSLANKFFDYIQAEVPVITMNFPEYENILQQYEVGVLLHELTHEAIVNAVQTFQHNETFYTNCRNACRMAKQEYNWQNESKKLLEIYAAL
jgi:glycosyltransferase involved in cell wall biosynthesis